MTASCPSSPRISPCKNHKITTSSTPHPPKTPAKTHKSLAHHHTKKRAKSPSAMLLLQPHFNPGSAQLPERSQDAHPAKLQESRPLRPTHPLLRLPHPPPQLHLLHLLHHPPLARSRAPRPLVDHRLPRSLHLRRQDPRQRPQGPGPRHSPRRAPPPPRPPSPEDRAHINELSVKQLVALRFATDEELPPLPTKPSPRTWNPKPSRARSTTGAPTITASNQNKKGCSHIGRTPKTRPIKPFSKHPSGIASASSSQPDTPPHAPEFHANPSQSHPAEPSPHPWPSA